MNLIVLLGQTSSGKSDLALRLAKKLGNSWIVGCDSRQIYQKLNLGTGKIEGVWETKNNLNAFYYENIPHFLIDYLDPYKNNIPYSLNNYVNDFNNLFNFSSKPKYLILTGGTGLYAKAIYNQIDLGIIDERFKNQYEDLKKDYKNLSLNELQFELKKKFPETELNNSDYHNPRRIISKLLKLISKKNKWSQSTSYPQFDNILIFAIKTHKIEEKIAMRLTERLKSGLIKEVESVQDLGYEKLMNLGLEYRLITLYLMGLLNYENLEEKLLLENIKYSKRQLTWLKKEPVIWVNTVEDILEQVESGE